MTYNRTSWVNELVLQHISRVSYDLDTGIYKVRTLLCAGARVYLLEVKARLLKIFLSTVTVVKIELASYKQNMHRQGHPYLTPFLMMFLIFKTLQWIHLTLLKEKKKKLSKLKDRKHQI